MEAHRRCLARHVLERIVKQRLDIEWTPSGFRGILKAQSKGEWRVLKTSARAWPHPSTKEFDADACGCTLKEEIESAAIGKTPVFLSLPRSEFFVSWTSSTKASP